MLAILPLFQESKGPNSYKDKALPKLEGEKEQWLNVTEAPSWEKAGKPVLVVFTSLH